MAFIYSRTIHFQETDAAGVVYFANLLALCHEAYEASLAEAGVDLRQFFSSGGEVAVPVALLIFISRCTVAMRSPSPSRPDS
jgi:1,4-dihydroxy-2-naphthoyl-CoA hydrolase